jgi:hypothetical protein
MALKLFNSKYGFSVGLDHDNVIDADGNIIANNLTVNNNTILANITATNITANTGVFTGNGSGLSSIAGSNVSGQVGNALVSGTVYANAQPNITSVGTLTSLGVTGNISAGNVSLANGNVAITYTPSSATGYGLTISAANTQGGTGYADFLKITNSSGGATNPNKSLRISSTGAIEIINSAYTTPLMILSDAGVMTVTGSISTSGSLEVSGKKAVNGPSFRAYANSNQTITSGSQEKVTFAAETFDTDGCFANSRFTPTVEGYYQFNSTVRLDGGAGSNECMIILYKNGSEYARGWNSSGTQFASGFWSMSVSDVAYANGSSDYFEVYVQQTDGANKTTTAGSAITHFSAVMVRGA